MISETWKPALDGLRERLLWGSGNLADTADKHEWNEDMVNQDFEDFDGDMSGVIMSAPASGGPPGADSHASGPQTPARGLPDPSSPVVDELPRLGASGQDTLPPVYAEPGRPSGVDSAQARTAEYQPPPAGTPLPSADDMLHAKPAMPTYRPDGVFAEPGQAGTPTPAQHTPFG